MASVWLIQATSTTRRGLSDGFSFNIEGDNADFLVALDVESGYQDPSSVDHAHI